MPSLAGVAIAVILSACGRSGTDGTDGTADEAGGADTAKPLAAEAATGATSGERPGSPGAGPGRVIIRMVDNMRFEPEHTTISPGDTVIWVNDGSIPHTSTDSPGTAAVPDHNLLPPGAEPWDSGILAAGETFEHVFTVSGEYAYLCVLHETAGMLGRLTVR